MKNYYNLYFILSLIFLFYYFLYIIFTSFAFAFSISTSVWIGIFIWSLYYSYSINCHAQGISSFIFIVGFLLNFLGCLNLFWYIFFDINKAITRKAIFKPNLFDFNYYFLTFFISFFILLLIFSYSLNFLKKINEKKMNNIKNIKQRLFAEFGKF
jgi:hypothetical protein